MKLSRLHLPDPSFTIRWSPFVPDIGVGRAVCGKPAAQVTKRLDEVTCQACLKRWATRPGHGR